VATAVTSAVWRITFSRLSTTDQRTFQVELANTTPRTVVDGVARALKDLGYNISAVTFIVVLP